MAGVGSVFGFVLLEAEDPAPATGYVRLGDIVWNLRANPILDQPEFIEVRSKLGFRE